MNGQSLPVWDSISTAWKKTYGVKGTVWLAFIIIAAVMIAFGLFQKLLPIFSWLIAILKNIAGLLLQAGLVFIGIQKARSLPTNYRTVFRNFETTIALRLIGLLILEVLLILPFILLIALCVGLGKIPPIVSLLIIALSVIAIIFIRLRLTLGIGIVMDKNMNPWPAIKQSFAMTKKHVLSLLGIYLLYLVFFIISLIPLGVGLIWTIPMGVVLYGVIYNSLIGNMKS